MSFSLSLAVCLCFSLSLTVCFYILSRTGNHVIGWRFSTGEHDIIQRERKCVCVCACVCVCVCKERQNVGCGQKNSEGGQWNSTSVQCDTVLAVAEWWVTIWWWVTKAVCVWGGGGHNGEIAVLCLEWKSLWALCCVIVFQGQWCSTPEGGWIWVSENIVVRELMLF